ncbi:MAG: sodium:proton antiporter [Ignavibacteriae bacterium]|nr:sodium:proton antiporter [Ignavibacteriota bacterium]
MIRQSTSPIIVLIGRLVSPFIQVFGLYVIFHGHYGPGGGFQGGAILAASLLLIRLCLDSETAQLQFRQALGTPVGILGSLAFAGIGLMTLLLGGEFLDYAFLPFGGMKPAEIRAMGILLVELGIGVAVMATLVAIFDDLIGLEDHG